MNNNFLILVRANFQTLWGSMRYSKRKKKYIPLTLMAVVFGSMIVFSMVLNAVGQTTAFIEHGVPEQAIYSAVSTTILLALLLSVFRGGTSNTSNDADFLLALPVTRNTILLSKSVSRYIFDLVLILTYMLPSIVVYNVMADSSAAVLLRGVLVTFMMPMMAVGVAYLLSWLIFVLSGRFPRTDLIKTLLMLVIFVVFIYFYLVMSGTLAVGGNVRDFVAKTGFLVWGADFVINGDVPAFGLFTLVTAALFALGVFLQSLIYGKKPKVWRSKNKKLSFNKRSPLAALFNKEIKFYFSITSYVINTIFSPAMAVMATAAVVVLRGDILQVFGEQLSDVPIDIPFIILAMFCFFPAMMTTSASSISLEGKSIRILRASPLDEHDVFMSKIFVHLLIIAPVSAACIVVCGLALKLTALEIILALIAVMMLALFIAFLGLYINLVFPKLDWSNETAVVKQSAAVLVTMLSGTLFACVPVVLYFVIDMDYLRSATISAFVFFVLAFFMWVMLMTDGRKRYREL